MGTCTSKQPKPNPYASRDHPPNDQTTPTQPPKSPPPPPNKNDAVSIAAAGPKKSPFFPFYSPSPSPAHYFKKSPAHSKSATSTPLRFFKRPFPPPSPAKHIKAVLLRRQGKKAAKSATAIPEEEEEEEVELDKRFGFSKEFTSRLEVGEEVGRGHFGYTCSATYKKGEHKGHKVAVKVIPKTKVQYSISLYFLFFVNSKPPSRIGSLALQVVLVLFFFFLVACRWGFLFLDFYFFCMRVLIPIASRLF
jgi:hypothetical protein